MRKEGNQLSLFGLHYIFYNERTISKLGRHEAYIGRQWLEDLVSRHSSDALS
jgi:hypothetical protein